VLPFRAGDMVLLGPGLPHAWVSSHRAATHQAAATVLQFAPELLTQPCLPELARCAPLAARASRGLYIEEPCRSRVATLLRRMHGERGLDRLAGFVRVLGLLAAHDACLSPIATRAVAATSGAAAPAGEALRIDRVIGWIHHNLGRELSIAAAARVAHVTPAAFSRFFAREAGKTFTRYVNDVRCGEACLRLQRAGLPVAAIASSCGFTTLSHFNQQFRLRTGMTPREFRQRSG
jgi:AraC-like DNA-binding protein